jgi:hypothetical protein
MFSTSNEREVCSADLDLFIALHSRYGANLGLREGEIFENFVVDLLNDYDDAKLNGELEQDLRPETIPIHWVHAIISDSSSIRISMQVKELILKHVDGARVNKSLLIAYFILLDATDGAKSVLEHWAKLTAQDQYEVFIRLIDRDENYMEFARYISATAHKEFVDVAAVPAGSGSLPFRWFVDSYLLEIVRRDEHKLKEILGMIDDQEIQLVARASAGAISESEIQRTIQDFLKGKRDGVLSCLYRFDFAISDEITNLLMEKDFEFCHYRRSKALQRLSVRSPNIVFKELELLTVSGNKDDCRTVVEYYNGPRFVSLKDFPLVVRTVVSHIDSTQNVFELTNILGWQITCAAFSSGNGRVVVAPEVLSKIRYDKQDQLEEIANEINKKCGITFHSRTLREAIVTVHRIRDRLSQ